MIYLPPKVVQEKYLRPNGLPDELIHEIPCPRYQGPGLTNPIFPKPVVEQFVEERRPKSLDKKSYGEEEGVKVVAANGTTSCLHQIESRVLLKRHPRKDYGKVRHVLVQLIRKDRQRNGEIRERNPWPVAGAQDQELIR